MKNGNLKMTLNAKESQLRLIYSTIKKHPEFRKTLIDYRKNWLRSEFYHEQIVIAGQYIADQVIRELDL